MRPFIRKLLTGEDKDEELKTIDNIALIYQVLKATECLSSVCDYELRIK